MSSTEATRGQAWLRDQVLGRDLCTGCGACVGLCPYQQFHHDRTAVIHECDRLDGRCYNYCPRSPGDLNALRAALFSPDDFIPELGAVKGLFMTRAADPALRDRAQHGGTVSALVKLALNKGLVQGMVLADGGGDAPSRGLCVQDAGQAAALAGSKFAVSPTVAAFNQASQTGSGPLGVVATPCQALALAKMRAKPWPGDEARTERLGLVIGLFCGWALDWRKLRALIAEKASGRAVIGMDIPPSKHACMELYTNAGVIEVPMAEVQQCVRESCKSCFDMTCEFADISVGGARSPKGWEHDRGWNQVIVRTEAGEKLLDLAREQGVLDFMEAPEGNLERLKAASLNKKNACIQSLAAKSGDADDLIFIREEEVLCR